MGLRSLVSSVLQRLRGNPDRFLGHATGVIHVGANEGQERDLYARHGLPVLWIEALPSAFDRLQQNISGYPRQNALQALVTDRDGTVHTFHVASNSGMSSSILPFGQHTKLWPDIKMVGDVTLSSTSLDTLLKDRPETYDALVLDTQGSELMVLSGAADILTRLRFIKIEAPNFDAYRGCPRVADFVSFLKPRGFRLTASHKVVSKPGVGDYFELLFTRPARTELI
jgi:FkbM family methyltransferase